MPDEPQATPPLAAATLAVAQWIIEEGQRSTPLNVLLGRLVERLTSGGVAVDRLAAAAPVFHPEVSSMHYYWEAGQPEVMEGVNLRAFEWPSARLGKPFDAGSAAGVSGGDPAGTGSLPADLKAAGYTGHLVLPLAPAGTVSFATRRPGGFPDAATALLHGIRPALSLVMRLAATERLTGSLLERYLGRDAARRVLNGQIRRGGATTIRSVVWYGDLRGFTELANRLPLKLLLHVLNDYFDAMIAPVQANGGEVLKLIGDGMLAVFRVGPRADIAQVCTRALSAARIAAASLHRLSERRVRAGKPPLHFGLALHFGDVVYGNVGSADRLDFTVIGPAVNLAVRLEALAARLGHEIIVSAAFAEHCAPSLRSIGAHAIKGLEEPQEAFVMPEAGRPTGAT